MTEQNKEPDQPSTTEAKPRSMGVALWYGVSAGIMGMLVLTAMLVLGVPWATGASAFTSSDGSMAPALPQGVLIVTQPVRAEDIEIADVIAFRPIAGDPTVVTHRVVDTARGHFITKGDANAAPDPEPVHETQVLGRLWYSVPLLGWLNAAVTGPWRAAALPVVAAVVCGYAAWTLVLRSRSRRRNRQR
ncbi:signal peptidase I [Microbacterium abyssi]|uniref:signal peptidase I n=1 Tax=Microbacterium abyssi TaxID=2782166 RepID=UPI001887283C|nr:signal peptidase I [Microbacterium sp. A18JL241]